MVIILLFVLIWGIRSTQLIAAISFMFIGLIWTAAFAMSTVGHKYYLDYFSGMFIGLGVDCVHLSLKYQELTKTESRDTALTQASRPRASTFSLAIGFLSFVPTPYRGLAEMGIISAGGMLIAVLSHSCLSQLFSVTKKPNKVKSLFSQTFDKTSSATI